MNVALRTSRPLGWTIAEKIKATDGVQVVDHDHIAAYWGGVAGEPLSYTTREEPDFTLSVLWPERIRPDELARGLHLNLHPAPLPAYRGRNAPVHAIINGDTEFGATLHYMDEGFDTGPIIAYSTFDIPPDATGRWLYEEAMLDAEHLFDQVWPAIQATHGRLPSSPQGEGRYYAADSLEQYRGSDDPTVVRALTFPGR